MSEDHVDLPFELRLRGALARARRVETESATWLVYELPLATYDRRSTMFLVFETEGVMRRVQRYPPDWSSLSDDALIALSWER